MQDRAHSIHAFAGFGSQRLSDQFNRIFDSVQFDQLFNCSPGHDFIGGIFDKNGFKVFDGTLYIAGLQSQAGTQLKPFLVFRIGFQGSIKVCKLGLFVVACECS